MTREHKLALIVGFALVLVLGVLISDHFSKARQAQMAGAGDIRLPTSREVGAATVGATPIVENSPVVQPASGAGRPGLQPLPGVAHASSDVNGPTGTQLVLNQNPATPLAGPGLVDVNQGNRFLPMEPHDSAPAGSGAPPVPAAPQIPMTRYDVKDGDTLYGIALKIYGEGKLWEKIRDSNRDKLGSGDTLHKGVTLLLPPKDVLLGKPYVPPVAVVPASTTRTPATDAAAKPAGDFREYVVKDGDTLVAIARKMLNSGKRYNEIIEANKSLLADPDALTTGMKLRIPAK